MFECVVEKLSWLVCLRFTNFFVEPVISRWPFLPLFLLAIKLDKYFKYVVLSCWSVYGLLFGGRLNFFGFSLLRFRSRFCDDLGRAGLSCAPNYYIELV